MEKELKDKIETIEHEIAALRKTIEAPDTNYKNWVREVPEIGGEYFFPSADEEFCWVNECYWVNESLWDNDLLDKSRLCFTKKADCELACEILNRQQELIGDWVADWSDYNQLKALLVWNFSKRAPLHRVDVFSKTQGVTCMPEGAAEKLIAEYGVKLAVVLK